MTTYWPPYRQRRRLASVNSNRARDGQRPQARPPEAPHLLPVLPALLHRPQPALQTSLLVSLDQLDLSERDYSQSDNPPILHRKEEFLPPSHPLRERFARLTRQEERAGLYRDTRTIGTREGWQQALDESGLRLRGHRLVRACGSAES